MAERKRTPDILAEIMAGNVVANEALPISGPAPETKKKAAKRKSPPVSPPTAFVESTLKNTPIRQSGQVRRAEPVTPAQNDTPKWEYLCASLQYYKGHPPAWRVRFENGRELDDWFIGPPVDEYLRQLGQEGWELCAASSGERLYGASDTRQYYFKRHSR